MGSPASIAGIGQGATAGGGILGAFGALSGGEANQSMYNYQAQVATLNAQIEKQNATYAVQQGEQQAQSYGLQAGQRFAQIKTSQASAGFDVNSGSDKAVQDSQRQVTNLDLTQIRSNANKTAYDYDTQAVGFQNQAALDTMAGANAMKAGEIGAFSSILGAAGSVSSQWLQGNQVGLYGNNAGSGGGQVQTVGGGWY